ncbi:MAG: LON peptidase substrate-binding domain-containing protein, partial [Bacteroidales bacterium]|nr:LON peptidase substrate-binding domain-containing protein [Bacteroidales bacterium]
MNKFSIKFDTPFDDEPEDSDFNIIPIISETHSNTFNADDIPTELPIMALRNAVLFPGVVMPITVGREKSVKLLKSLPN